MRSTPSCTRSWCGSSAGNLQAPEWVIEDACQTAWGTLLIIARNWRRAPSSAGWSTTATRLALRLLRRERRAARGRAAGAARLDDYRTTTPGPEQVLAARERLAEIRRLPIRQQRS